MKILLVNQYFWPDLAATAQLLVELAEDLAAGRADVTALAGRGSYVPGRTGKLARREEWRGVRIHRVWCTSFGRGSLVGRVADYLTFLASAAVAVLFGRQHDVVVCLSTPPLVGVLGLLARVRGSRFVCKVEDLYPDVAVALGTLRERSPVTSGSAALSHLLLRRADAAVALDQRMQQTLQARGVCRVEVIPNWADGGSIRPDAPAGARFREAHGLPASFVVLYSGNLGLAHRFDAVIEAARALAGRRPDVVFLFVGAGPRLGEVRTLAKGLPNVRFMPYQPREMLGELYNAADVHLVTLRDEVAGMLVPSKYPAALAAGKPVLLVGGGNADLWREITEEQLGWCCPHEASAVVKAVEDAAQRPEGCRACGRRARNVFEARYDRRIATARWLALLREVAGGTGYVAAG